MTDQLSRQSLLPLATGLEKLRSRVVGAYDGTWMMHSEAVAVLEEIERLRTALTGISTCSTCEACRGAAKRALGEKS